jgi:hypothetical protein
MRCIDKEALMAKLKIFHQKAKNMNFSEHYESTLSSFIIATAIKIMGWT